MYAFQIFPAQKPAVNLRLLANTLLSLVGREGEASFGCEVSRPFKSCLFSWLLIYSELSLSKPGLDSYLTGLDHIDRHRLTAPGLEDSIQALLGQNEEEAVQMFLKHAGKFLFQQDRWNMINLNSCRRSTSFNSAWSSPCLWCEDLQHLFDFEKEFSIIKDNFKKCPTSLKPFESIKGKGWLGSTLCLPWTSEAFYALPKKQQWSTGSHFFCGNYKWIITILNKVQLLASQLRRTAYVGVLGAPLILSVLVPFCHSTWQLCLTPILPCLFLWSVVKIFLRTLDGDVWFPFVVLDWS